MPHRVLHLLGTAQPEGSSIVQIVANLARHLDPTRYTMDAWFLEGGGPLANSLEKAGASVRTFDVRGWRGAEGTWKLWRALSREGYSIVHLHYWSRRLRWLVRATTSTKILLHLHSHVSERRGLQPVWLDTSGSDLVIATSQAVAQWTKGSRAHVIYPGVSLPEDFDCGPAVETTGTGMALGTAGRLVPMKGIVHLIRALALVRQRVPDVRLYIAGSGPEQPALESEARSLGILDAVTFLGWRGDLPRVLKSWDLYVQPSVMEPFGVAAMEAMAAGLPVVATAAGGLPELVEEGRTGRLVPPANPTLLADRIAELLLNPEQRKTLGTAGRARVREKFSVQRMVAAISDLYDQLLADKSHAATAR